MSNAFIVFDNVLLTMLSIATAVNSRYMMPQIAKNGPGGVT